MVTGIRNTGKGCWTGDKFYSTLFCVNKCARFNHCGTGIQGSTTPQYIWNEQTTSGTNGKTVQQKQPSSCISQSQKATKCPPLTIIQPYFDQVTKWDAIQEVIHSQKFLKIALQMTAKMRKYRELTGIDYPNHADYFKSLLYAKPDHF